MSYILFNRGSAWRIGNDRDTHAKLPAPRPPRRVADFGYALPDEGGDT